LRDGSELPKKMGRVEKEVLGMAFPEIPRWENNIRAAAGLGVVASVDALSFAALRWLTR
jgi:hypothetical protein